MKRTDNIKIAIYAVCFLLFCVIDWVVGTQTGRVQMTFVNLLGCIVSAIYFVSVDYHSFLKKKYIYVGLCLIIAISASMVIGSRRYELVGQWNSAMVDIFIYIIIAINIFDRFRDKNIFNTKYISRVAFGLTALIFVLVICSKYDGLWPLLYYAMLIAFLSIDFTKESIVLLVKGAIIGVISGYLIIQGFALVLRPYDELRYKGFHINCNMNGLFYTLAVAAMLCAYLWLRRENKCVFLRVILALLVCYTGGLIILSEGRTALFSFGLELVVFAVVFTMMAKRKSLAFFTTAAILSLGILIAVPLSYVTVRYIPAFFHHPVWFEGEYSEDRVHSFDPIDSEKYISFEDAMENSVGRLLFFSDGLQAKIVDFFLPAIKAEAKASDEPLFEEMPENFVLRDVIRKYYLSKASLFGNKRSEAGVWISEDYNAPHAHNVFVQFLFDFGYIAFVPFLIYVVFIIYRLITYLYRREYITFLVTALPNIIFFSFGFFEIAWRTGQLSLSLFLLSQYGIIYDLRKIREKA